MLQSMESQSQTLLRLNNNNERVPFHVFVGYFVSSFVKDLFRQFDCFGGTAFLTKKLDWEGIVVHKQLISGWGGGDTLAYGSVIRVGSQKQNLRKGYGVEIYYRQ